MCRNVEEFGMKKSTLLRIVFALFGPHVICGQPCASNDPLRPISQTIVSWTSTPSLIGFSEYVAPSIPPKKYRRQVTHSDNPFLVCGPLPTNCAVSNCPSSISFSWQGKIPGQDFNFAAAGSLNLIGIADGMATYQAN